MFLKHRLLWPIWRGPYYMLQNVHAPTFIALRAIIILRLHQSPWEEERRIKIKNIEKIQILKLEYWDIFFTK